VIINFILLFINLVWCVIALSLHTSDITKSAKLYRFAIGAPVLGKCESSRLRVYCLSPCVHSGHQPGTYSLTQSHTHIAVVIFQIGLCLMVHCVGISIIWCAMGGWIISERKRLKATEASNLSSWRNANLIIERFIVVLDVGVILYYAFTSKFITTVAHVCAMVLGATLSLMSIRLYDDAESENTVGPSTHLLNNPPSGCDRKD